MAKDKHPLKSACTEARQDMARFSFSMRNSRFKYCCLLHLVYEGSSQGEQTCIVKKAERGAAILLLEQWEAGERPAGWAEAWDRDGDRTGTFREGTGGQTCSSGFNHSFV